MEQTRPALAYPYNGWLCCAIVSERLQKLLAGAGHGSRRGIEEWIRAGRVTINGKLASLGDRASSSDQICLDGKPLRSWRQRRDHRGAAVSQARRRGDHAQRSAGSADGVRSLAAAGDGRWIVVGRLDVNTSGLLLFTNDGDLAHRLMHPSRRSSASTWCDFEAIRRRRYSSGYERGVQLDDGPANFDRIEVGNPPRAATAGAASACTRDAIGRCGGCSSTRASR